LSRWDKKIPKRSLDRHGGHPLQKHLENL
jgi:hypothetical protein